MRLTGAVVLKGAALRAGAIACSAGTLVMTYSLLERRRIEAQFAKAIFDVLAEETGRERAAEILAKAVIRLATEAGAAFAGQRREPPDKMAPDDPAGLLAYVEILAL